MHPFVHCSKQPVAFVCPAPERAPNKRPSPALRKLLEGELGADVAEMCPLHPQGPGMESTLAVLTE